ncbi:MAG: NfeD family protein [Chloroflexi bacterium]|nr:MAG: NfeD family protein [Chloroflexota bacterium]TMG34145.1 MAG: NfeD family protein [Chloroflexota bacterium]
MVPTAAAEALQFAPMPGFWFWLIVAGALVVVEILTLAFFAAFIAAAAVGAALAALLGFNPLVQAIVLLVLGVGGIGAARPLLMQALARRREPVLRSGAENMIGQQAILTDPIVDMGHPGHVKIAGELWPAITADGSSVPANTPVVVTALKSTTLIVQARPSATSQTT